MQILDQDLLRTTVKRITLCGDLGDPIYNKDFLDIVEYIKVTNPNIHVFTITNGSYQKEDWWQRFAAISNNKDTINFSVDGFDDESNRIYRVNAHWDSIMLGMRTMTQKSTAFVNWATIFFRFNQHRIDNIVDLARDIGCDSVQMTKSTKFGSKYPETYHGESDDLEPAADKISCTNRYERFTIPLSQRRLDTDDYMQTKKLQFSAIKKSYDRVITPVCLIGTQGLYVNADGLLFPCSWKGLPYSSLTNGGKVISFQDDFFRVNKQVLDLHYNNIQDVLNNDVWSVFFDNLGTNNAWQECRYKCATHLVTEKYAVGWETN